MEERSLYVWGAGAAIAGAIVGAVANVIHPRVTEYGGGYTEALVTEVSQSTSWIGIHIVLLFSVLLITVGFIAFARSMRDSGGLQHIAMAAALGGGVIGFITLGIDGYAMQRVSDAWSLAQDDATMAAVTAVSGVGWGSFMILVFSLFGAAPFFLGWAIVTGNIYPKWLGWVAIVIGAVSFVQSAWGMLSGPTAGWFGVYLPLSLAATLWAIVGAVYLRRHAEAPAMATARP